jgi:hypothetical protein
MVIDLTCDVALPTIFAVGEAALPWPHVGQEDQRDAVPYWAASWVAVVLLIKFANESEKR